MTSRSLFRRICDFANSDTMVNIVAFPVIAVLAIWMFLRELLVRTYVAFFWLFLVLFIVVAITRSEVMGGTIIFGFLFFTCLKVMFPADDGQPLLYETTVGAMKVYVMRDGRRLVRNPYDINGEYHPENMLPTDFLKD